MRWPQVFGLLLAKFLADSFDFNQIFDFRNDLLNETTYKKCDGEKASSQTFKNNEIGKNLEFFLCPHHFSSVISPGALCECIETFPFIYYGYSFFCGLLVTTWTTKLF